MFSHHYLTKLNPFVKFIFCKLLDQFYLVWTLFVFSQNIYLWSEAAPVDEELGFSIKDWSTSNDFSSLLVDLKSTWSLSVLNHASFLKPFNSSKHSKLTHWESVWKSLNKLQLFQTNTPYPCFISIIVNLLNSLRPFVINIP